jgi:hypothetical protein
MPIYISKENKMLPHQQRVVDVKAELDDKLSKLKAFTETDLFKSLAVEDRVLLDTQATYMDAYSRTLGKRIDRF